MLQKRLASYTIQGAILATSIFIGIYFGKKYIFPNEQEIMVRSVNERLPYPDHIKLAFPIGTLLPDISLTDSTGATYHTSDLIGDNGSIFIFSSMSCTECPLLLREWNEQVMPEIRDGVNVYTVLPEGESFFTSWETDLLRGKSLLYYNQNTFERDYNLVALPAILCVDRDGTVFDIQYGHGAYYHREIIEHFTNWDLPPEP